MASLILTNVRYFAGAADLTGSSNKCELSAQVEEKDVTTFNSLGWKESVGGLASSTIAASGFWEAGDAGKIDNESWADLGALTALSVGPSGASVGDLAYLTKAFKANYKLGGSVGDVAPWEANASGSWPMVRGQFAHPPGTARTSNGTGTGLDLGAVASGKRLYAALHVLSVSGTGTPTITVTVESDVDNTFTTPATQITFSDAIAVGSQITRTDGSAITDSWFRAKWTVSGTSPSFTFVVALGIA